MDIHMFNPGIQNCSTFATAATLALFSSVLTLDTVIPYNCCDLNLDIKMSNRSLLPSVLFVPLFYTIHQCHSDILSLDINIVSH